jgi:hypothetical protein
MPSFRGQLTSEQVGQLVAYIKSLGAAAPAGRPVTGYPPFGVPDQPPAKGSTDYDRNIGDYHNP